VVYEGYMIGWTCRDRSCQRSMHVRISFLSLSLWTYLWSLVRARKLDTSMFLAPISIVNDLTNDVAYLSLLSLLFLRFTARRVCLFVPAKSQKIFFAPPASGVSDLQYSVMNTLEWTNFGQCPAISKIRDNLLITYKPNFLTQYYALTRLLWKRTNASVFSGEPTGTRVKSIWLLGIHAGRPDESKVVL